MTRPELLSDKEVLQETKTLVARECQTTLAILILLGEVEQRKLHTRLGYPSMFEYCRRHLRYSASAAGRRVQVARCMRRFSRARQLFASGEVNLSTLGILAPVLTEVNAAGLLDKIRNTSQRDVERIVCGERPAVIVRDRVKPVRVIVPAKPPRSGGGSSSRNGDASLQSSEPEQQPSTTGPEANPDSRRRLSKKSFSA